MKVYTTADDTGLLWTDPDVFKRFVIGPLISDLSPDERKEAFEKYMKMDADELVNDDKLTGGSYESYDSDDIDDTNMYKNMSLRDLYGTDEDTDPFDADLYDLLDSGTSSVSVDANGDGDTDNIKVDVDGDGETDIDATNTDDEEESEALDKLDEAADKAAEENPISIDKVDKMADEAAEENPFSLDNVDKMADEHASLDSTGRLDKDRLSKKLTPEQQKLEDTIGGRQKNILSALADRLF